MIYENGVVKEEETLTPIGKCPSCIPKVGMTLRIPKEFGTMSWYGRGPQENYPDRKREATIGIHSRLVDSLWRNYVRPQENGNRDDD